MDFIYYNIVYQSIVVTLHIDVFLILYGLCVLGDALRQASLINYSPEEQTVCIAWHLGVPITLTAFI